MSLTVAELVGIPHLQVTVLAGAGDLNRIVTWAHVSEMDDPTPWLEGGELLMRVGIGFPDDPDAQTTYLRRLADRGLAALALGTPATSRLSEGFLDAANERGFPVLEIGWEVPFSEVARIVVAASERSSQRRLMTHVQIFDSLRARVVDGLDAAQLFARLEEISGYSLYLATPRHEQLLDGVPVPPEAITDALPMPLERAVSVGEARVLPVFVRGDHVGYVVAVERQGAKAAGVVAIHHIETLAALEVERMLSETRLAQTFGAVLLEDMLDGQLGPTGIQRRLASQGFDTSEMLVLTALRRGNPLDPGALVDELVGTLRQRQIPHLVTSTEPVFLLAPNRTAVTDAVAELSELIAGASRPFAITDGVVLARRDAQLALDIAVERGLDVVRAGTDVDYSLLFAADRASLERLVNSVLGPLIAYDKQHQTELVQSLRCYLEQNRSIRDAAALLFVHTNSLTYRLRRIEEIIGRRLISIATQTELWIALEAQRLLDL